MTLEYPRSDIVFEVERSKVKVIGSINAFFILIVGT